MKFMYSDREGKDFPHSFSIIGIMSEEACKHALSLCNTLTSKFGRLGEEGWIHPNPRFVEELENLFGPMNERWTFEGCHPLISVCIKFKNKDDAMRFRIMYDNV